MKTIVSVLVALSILVTGMVFPIYAEETDDQWEWEGTVLEKRIAAIGEVTWGNYEDKGAEITQLEQEVASLLLQFGVDQNQLERDASDYIKNYFLLLDARKQYDLCVRENKKQIATRLWIAQDPLTVGGPLEVFYQIKNLSAASGTYKYQLQYNPLYLSADGKEGVITGEVTLEPQQQETVAFSLTVRQGGRADLTASVTGANNAAYPARTLPLTIDGKGCYLGCTHNHSTESDGSGSFAQNFYYMMNNGMSVTYTTDHMPSASISNLSYFNTAVNAIQACGYSFAAIKGAELTVYSNNGHMLSYGNRLNLSSPPAERTQKSIDSWNENISRIHAAGGYTYLAHPFCAWYNFPGFASAAKDRDSMHDVEWYDDQESILYLYPEVTGIEVINVGYNQKNLDYHINNLKAIAYWQRLNCTGYKKYFGSGGSDGHSPSATSTVHNGFMMDGLTTNAFEDAHRNGRFFITTNPEMRYYIEDKTFGETLIAAKDTAQLSVEVYCDISHLDQVVLLAFPINEADPLQGHKSVEKTVLYQYEQEKEKVKWLTVNQEIPVKDGYFYILEVYAARLGAVAFSNPIWVFGKERGDVDGDQKVNATDALAVLRNAVGTAAFNLRKNEMGDMDENGKIDAVDALRILQKAVGIAS